MVTRTAAPGATLDDETTDLADKTTEEVTREGDDALFLRFKNWYRVAQTHSAPWRSEAEELSGMVAGHQWDEDALKVLRDQGRPATVFNRMGPVIDSICGLEINNRQEVQYLPRQLGDSKPNEIFNAAAKWARDECNAEDEESDAFRDSVITGMGWTETRVSYEQDPDGLLEIDRVDGLEMFWDSAAKKRNLADRRYHMRACRMPLEDAEAMFPGVAAVDLDAKWAEMRDVSLPPHDATEAKFYRHDQSFRDSQGRDRAMVTIVYVEWWVREPYYRVVDPQTGERADMGGEQFERLQQRAAVLGIGFQHVKLTRKVYMQAFVGNRILERKPGRCKYGFSINCITGRRDRNQNLWYGVARAMKDPQQWANKFFSTIQHRISTTGKGLLLEKTAVDNVAKFEEKWAAADGVKIVKDGAISGGKFKQLDGVALVPAESAMLEFAISSIRDSTGVNLELIGLADRQQAGVLEAQRKQAGMTILATLFDSLRLYRKEQGKVMLYMIQEYFPPGRLIRITDDHEVARYAPLLKDPQTVEYDVIVDEAPASPNQKEQTWALLVPMAPMLMKAGLPGAVWAELLKYSPLPSSLVQTIGQALDQPPQPNPKDIAEADYKAAQAEKARAETAATLAGIGQPQGVQQHTEPSAVEQFIAAMLERGAEQRHEAAMADADRAFQASESALDRESDLRAQVLDVAAAAASQDSAQRHRAAESSAARFKD